MGQHTQFMAALKHAAWNNEKITIGGGIFKPSEYKPLIPVYDAAPELLEALEDIIRDEERRRCDLKNGSPAYKFASDRILKARAAIAKAKGE